MVGKVFSSVASSYDVMVSIKAAFGLLSQPCFIVRNITDGQCRTRTMQCHSAYTECGRTDS